MNITSMGWRAALCFFIAVALGSALIAAWVANWLADWELRAIRRKRKKMRVLYRELNRHRPGIFSMRKQP